MLSANVLPSKQFPCRSGLLRKCARNDMQEASLRELQSATGEELSALLQSVLDRALKGDILGCDPPWEHRPEYDQQWMDSM